MDNIPVKLDKKMTAQLDALVRSGLYLSRSEALREGARRLILTDYLSVNEYLKRLATIAAEIIGGAFTEEVAEVRLFGSVARGEAGPDSDVDLLVLTRQWPTTALEASLHKLLLPISLGADVLFTSIVLSGRELERQTKAGYTFTKEIRDSLILFSRRKGKRPDAAA